jgi:hypothetical protein
MLFYVHHPSAAYLPSSSFGRQFADTQIFSTVKTAEEDDDDDDNNLSLLATTVTPRDRWNSYSCRAIKSVNLKMKNIESGIKKENFENFKKNKG